MVTLAIKAGDFIGDGLKIANSNYKLISTVVASQTGPNLKNTYTLTTSDGFTIVGNEDTLIIDRVVGNPNPATGTGYYILGQ